MLSRNVLSFFICQMKGVPFLLVVWNLKIHFLSSFSCSPVLLFYHDQIRKDGQFKTLNVPSDESLVSMLPVWPHSPFPCSYVSRRLCWVLQLLSDRWLSTSRKACGHNIGLSVGRGGTCWPTSTCPGLFRASATTMHAVPGRPTGVHPDVVIWC